MDASNSGHLEALQVFFRVVERGSFTAVARELGLTQSTISRRIASLERELGVRLLNRTTRRVSPTGAGRALHDRGARALQALLAVEDDVRAGESQVHGTVRVAAPAALGRALVLPILTEALRRQPRLTLDLRLSDQVLDFVGAGIDFAVRVGRPPEASLAARVLGSSTQLFVASPRYVRAHGRPTKMADLRRHALVLRPPVQDQRAPFEAVRVSVRVDDVDAALAAVHAGLGVGLLPRWLVADAVARRALVACAEDAPTFAVPVCVVRPVDAWLPKRTRLLLDAVIEGLPRRLLPETFRRAPPGRG